MTQNTETTQQAEPTANSQEPKANSQFLMAGQIRR